MLFILLVAGLDGLFRWTSTLQPVGENFALVVILAGYAWSSWALIENRFFSGVVRIQKERGHEVVSTGPYAIMRHPGYVGALLLYLGTPFFLDSWWTLLPAVLLVIVMVLTNRVGGQDAAGGVARVPRICREGTLPVAAGGMVEERLRGD